MVVYEKGKDTYRDVILAGTVTSVQKKKTKEGGNKLLFVTIRSKVYEADLEEYLAEDNEIVFADNPDGNFGPEEFASKAEKKLKKNRQVIIKASEKVSVSEEGEEERRFYGRTVDFVGKHYKTKNSDRGPASNVLVGYVIPKEASDDNEASIGIPINFYDSSAKENYTVFASLTGDNLDELIQKYKYDKDAGEKCKIASMVIADYAEEKDKETKRISKITGKVISDTEILFGDKIEES